MPHIFRLFWEQCRRSRAVLLDDILFDEAHIVWILDEQECGRSWMREVKTGAMLNSSTTQRAIEFASSLASLRHTHPLLRLFTLVLLSTIISITRWYARYQKSQSNHQTRLIDPISTLLRINTSNVSKDQHQLHGQARLRI